MMEIDGEEVFFTITCVSNTSIKYLHIVWDFPLPFDEDTTTEEEARQFIKEKQIYKESFDKFFHKMDDSNYYLCVRKIDYLSRYQTRKVWENQIETYKPLIQQFILDPDTYPKSKGK